MVFVGEQVYDGGVNMVQLVMEVGCLSTDASGRGIRHHLCLLDQAHAVVLADVDRFDRSLEWAIAGYPSLVAWLADNHRCTRGEAKRLVVTMEALRVLPVVAAAYAEGTLSGGQVRAIVSIVPERLRPKFAEIEADMVPLLSELTVNDTIRVLREWVARAEAETEDPEPAAEVDHVHFSPTLDNSFKLDGVLSGEDAVTFGAGLTACLPEVVEGEPVLSLSQRQAIALVEMARRVLQAGQVTVRRQVDVTLIITPDELAGGIARYANGTIVPADRVQRLLCDSVITPIVTGDHGQPLWMGRAVRTATNAQWRALVARDRHCAFPGCHRPSGWCEAHHIREYDRDQGPTDINNLVLLCSALRLTSRDRIRVLSSII
jgi:Domain of unknown function (DUF222)/HNH endonuclease